MELCGLVLLEISIFREFFPSAFRESNFVLRIIKQFEQFIFKELFDF